MLNLGNIDHSLTTKTDDELLNLLLPKDIFKDSLDYLKVNFEVLFSLEILDRSVYNCLNDKINLIMLDPGLDNINFNLLEVAEDNSHFDFKVYQHLLNFLEKDLNIPHKEGVLGNLEVTFNNLDLNLLTNTLNISVGCYLKQLESNLLGLERLIRRKNFNLQNHNKDNLTHKELSNSCNYLASQVQLMIAKLNGMRKEWLNLALSKPLILSSDVFNTLFVDSLVNATKRVYNLNFNVNPNNNYNSLVSNFVGLIAIIKEFCPDLSKINKVLNLIADDFNEYDIARQESAKLTYLIDIFNVNALCCDLNINMLRQQDESYNTVNLILISGIARENLKKLITLLLAINRTFGIK